jgi:hypothetical protein
MLFVKFEAYVEMHIWEPIQSFFTNEWKETSHNKAFEVSVTFEKRAGTDEAVRGTT